MCGGARGRPMNEDQELHVVIGASGGTGSALVRELCKRGRRVRAVNRSGQVDVPPGVDVVAADARDADRMREVCRGRWWSTTRSIRPSRSGSRRFPPLWTECWPVPNPAMPGWSLSTTPGCTVARPGR
ncbi:hypothetical protein FNH13_18025 [Ornithinimicrobium ciconiae]|uniref:NAD(P)-binding domain-containing protein n=1 Tax=Ornithinimicrobium ciconiae TaxID=2594265 RepID=A0A516GEN0_9MICO|nr:hypothetical protein FNH13_18025 [Ornithinimicrobium ciconiae]